MALTLNNFTGFETDGNEEASSIVGSPDIQATTVRTGGFSLELTTGNDDYIIAPFALIASSGTDYIIGFGYRTDSVVADHLILRVRDSSDNQIVQIRVEGSSSKIEVRDIDNTTQITSTNTISSGEFLFVEVYWEQSATGNISLFINNTSEGTGTGNFNVTPDDIICEGSVSRTKQYDDIYFLSGATAASDRFGDFAVKAYQNTAEDATDQGDTLVDVGAGGTGTWANLSQTPGVATDDNAAQYQDTGNLTGSTICDEGDRSGPSGDSDVTGATIKGAKWIGNFKRTGGGGRTHSLLTGSDETSTGFPQATTTIALTTDYVIHERLVEAPTAEVPTTDDFFQHGFSKSATAGQDILCSEIWSMLGYVPSAGAIPVINLIMAPYKPT